MRAREGARSGEAPGWLFQMSGDVSSGDGINGVCRISIQSSCQLQNSKKAAAFNQLETDRKPLRERSRC
jgi:hypothetical protein